MIEIAALVLCKLGGKSGSADDIKAVLEAAGLTVDEEQLTKLTGAIDGKDINALLASGAGKLTDVPFGAGGGGPGEFHPDNGFADGLVGVGANAG